MIKFELFLTALKLSDLSQSLDWIHSLNRLVSFASLLLILDDVLHLQLAHALDFIEIYYETFIVSVKRLNALSAEDSQMV